MSYPSVRSWFNPLGYRHGGVSNLVYFSHFTSYVQPGGTVIFFLLFWLIIFLALKVWDLNCPDKGLNLRSPHWKLGVLTAGHRKITNFENFLDSQQTEWRPEVASITPLTSSYHHPYGDCSIVQISVFLLCVSEAGRTQFISRFSLVYILRRLTMDNLHLPL